MKKRIKNYAKGIPCGNKPQKSYLVSGVTLVLRPLNIVIAIDDKIDYLLIITAYEPDKKKWDENFSRRI